jgi:NADH-quinone oxidoreductase subunit E
MLSPDSLKKIDLAVAKYPANQKQSAVMAALTVAQDEKGHLSTEVMDFVAGYLGMPPIAVYEVASFYAMYDLKKPGKYKLCICTNLPCALSGAEHAAEHLKKASVSAPAATRRSCWSTTRPCCRSCRPKRSTDGFAS